MGRSGWPVVMPDTIDTYGSLILRRDAQKLNLVFPAIAQNALNGNSSEKGNVWCRLCVSRGRKHGYVSSQVLKMSKMSYRKLYIVEKTQYIFFCGRIKLFYFCSATVVLNS